MPDVFDTMFGLLSKHVGPTPPPRFALTPVGAALMRRWYVDNIFRPIAAFALQHAPELQSMGFLVAQFFDGETADEVHMDYLYSVRPTPDFVAARTLASDRVNLPDWPSRDAFEDAVLPPPEQRPTLPPWNGTLDAISAFAAFCDYETCEPTDASFSPYVVFRRGKDSLEEEIVGTPVRPWLDGIAPSAEPELTPSEPVLERAGVDADALLGKLSALHETLADLATAPTTEGSMGAEIRLLRTTLDEMLAHSRSCRDLLVKSPRRS